MSVTKACFILWWLALAGLWGLGDPAVLRWLVLYAGLAMLLGCFTVRRFRRLDMIDWLTLALLVYAAESLLWAVDWRNGVWALQNGAAAAFVFLMVRRIPKVLEAVPDAAAAVLALAIGLYWIFPVQNGGFGNENFLAEHMLILIPLVVTRRFALVAIIAVVCLTFTGSRLPYLAVAAVVSAALVLRWPKSIPGLAAVAPLLIAVTWDSWKARAEIWFNSFYAIREAPLFGHGIGGFQAAYEPFRERHYVWSDYTVTANPSKLVGDAHNEIIQFAMTLGGIGVVLGLALSWAILRNCERGDGTSWALLLVVVFSMIEFPLHNPWTLVTALLCAARVAPYAWSSLGALSPASDGRARKCTAPPG